MTAIFGRDLLGDPMRPNVGGILRDRFIMPPFSVLDARGGPWRERKEAWLALGIQSEIGRGDALAYSGASGTDFVGLKMAEIGGTSVFDPVLCELAYRWFCPPGGVVIDPFAGGSVRGVVAALLGFKYVGFELRAEQVTANRAQAEDLLADAEGVAEWICGDANDHIRKMPHCWRGDMVFTCPPYGDLEVYSDDPRDLSVMDWEGFSAAYKTIALRAVDRMNDDGFAVLVVGNMRDKRTGFMRDLVGLTVSAFELAGARLFNEAVLVTPAGTARMRANQFDIGRKMCRTHQTVLVFCKGEPRRAAERCING